LDQALSGFLNIVPLVMIPPTIRGVISRLDLGEQQAVALAYERKALLVIDDRMGRVTARRLGLAVTGLVGVLVQAKDCGLISAVRPLLEDIRRWGYWLSDELLDLAAKLAGKA
jgi:predicted nucleic acid-binding protein